MIPSQYLDLCIQLNGVCRGVDVEMTMMLMMTMKKGKKIEKRKTI